MSDEDFDTPRFDSHALAKIVYTGCPDALLAHLNNDTDKDKWNNLWNVINRCFDSTDLSKNPDTEYQELAIRALLSEGILESLIENGIYGGEIEYLLASPPGKVVKALVQEEFRLRQQPKDPKAGILGQLGEGLRHAGVCPS